MSQTRLSTGILQNNEAFPIAVHVDVANVDPDNNRTIRVEGINWGTGVGPIGPVGFFLAPTTVTLLPNTRQEFIFTVPSTDPNTHYEVRVTYEFDDVLVTTKATNAVTANTGWLEGHTVLKHDFTQVDLD